MTKIMRGSVKCIRCGKESEQLFIFNFDSSVGNKEDNEKLLRYRQRCPYCGYQAISIDFNQPLYKFTEVAFDCRNQDDWSKREWILYGNLTVKFKEIYPNGNVIEKTCFISGLDIKKIDREIEEARKDERIIEAYDGSVWEFTKYDCGKEVWYRPLGYIYGVEPLEVITRRLYDLVFNSGYALDQDEKAFYDMLGLTSTEEEKGTSKIVVNVNNDKHKFQMALYNNDNNNYSMTFAKADDINVTPIAITKDEFEEFDNKVKELSQPWAVTFTGEKNINWEILVDDKNIGSGNGGTPVNWSSVVDLLIKYERLYKAKTIG